MNVLSLDVSSLHDARQRLTEGVQKFNHVDVLVNSAGITHTATLVDTPEEKFKVLYYTMFAVCHTSLVWGGGVPRISIFACAKNLNHTHNYNIQSHP